MIRTNHVALTWRGEPDGGDHGSLRSCSGGSATLATNSTAVPHSLRQLAPQRPSRSGQYLWIPRCLLLTRSLPCRTGGHLVFYYLKYDPPLGHCLCSCTFRLWLMISLITDSCSHHLEYSSEAEIQRSNPNSPGEWDDTSQRWEKLKPGQVCRVHLLNQSIKWKKKKSHWQFM